jgi:hypothetical protein
MNSLTGLRVALLLTVSVTAWPTAAAAQTPPVLPAPLSLGDVIRLASERRDEIQAARARTRAGEARPTIVSALQDPMISPSLDHLPFMLGGADVSFTIEQQIPLSVQFDRQCRLRHPPTPFAVDSGGCSRAPPRACADG